MGEMIMCELAQKAIQRLKNGLMAYRKKELKVPNKPPTYNWSEEETTLYKKAIANNFCLSSLLDKDTLASDLQRERQVLELSAKLKEFKERFSREKEPIVV
jgi:hypothetical protein